MSLVYVTGISGAGKSAVCAELRLRGYPAHDTDQDDNAVWVSRATGEVVTERPAVGDRQPEWHEQHEWRMVPARVEELAQRSKGRRAFVCGATANDREVWHHFSKVIYLTVDEATLLRRITARTTNDFGKSPHELAAILDGHNGRADRYRAYGAAVVDATRPLDAVVDDMITCAGTRAPMMSRWLFKWPRIMIPIHRRRPSVRRRAED